MICFAIQSGKFRYGFAGFIIASIFIFAAGTSSASTTEDVKKGNLLYNEKKYSEAVKIYDRGLDSRPDDVMLRFNKGDALYKNGSYSAAIESYNKAIAQGKAWILADADYNIGNSNYKIGAQQAKSDMQKAKES
jgi:tetratricopeptide (TPR) repeat protein